MTESTRFLFGFWFLLGPDFWGLQQRVRSQLGLPLRVRNPSCPRKRPQWTQKLPILTKLELKRHKPEFQSHKAAPSTLNTCSPLVSKHSNRIPIQPAWLKLPWQCLSASQIYHWSCVESLRRNNLYCFLSNCLSKFLSNSKSYYKSGGLAYSKFVQSPSSVQKIWTPAQQSAVSVKRAKVSTFWPAKLLRDIPTKWLLLLRGLPRVSVKFRKRVWLEVAWKLWNFFISIAPSAGLEISSKLICSDSFYSGASAKASLLI